MTSTSQVVEKVDTLWLSFLRDQRKLLDELDVGIDREFSAVITIILRTDCTQAEWASVLSVSPSSIHRWKRGLRMPSILVRESAIVRIKNHMDTLILKAAAS